MFKFAFFIFIASGWGLAAASLYLVRSPDGFTLVTKDSLTFTDTYADTRTWERKDVAEHRDVIARLVQANKTRMLAHIVEDEKGDVKEQLSDALEKAPPVSRVWAKARAAGQSSKSQPSKVTPGDLLDLALGN
jgi:hypothetical protein